MDLLKQRDFDIAYHVSVLTAEFSRWQKRTAEDDDWKKHFSQVRRLTTQLGAFIQEAAGVAGAVPAGAAPTDGGPDGNADPAGDASAAYTRLLFAHRIWAYYRSLFAQREIDALRDELRCVDELAWACYQPARDKAIAAGTVDPTAVKEPPLVYFGNDASPNVQGRATPLNPLTQDISTLDIERFGQALLLLPMPIIAMPWFQSNHLPSAVLVAHEVGHAVEHDFGLGPPLKELFETMDLGSGADARRAAWLAWRREIFADVYGILCTGPAHVMALMRYMVDSADAIQRERISGPAWGRYPSRYLRMLLNFETLDQIGIEDAGTRAAWSDTYGAHHAMSDFAADVPMVVGALLAMPTPMFGPTATIGAVIRTSKDDWAKIGRLAERINTRGPLASDTPQNHLFAATTLAYQSEPQTYLDRDRTFPVIRSLADTIPSGVRGAVRGVVRGAVRGHQDPGAFDAQAAADEAAGRALSALFAFRP